MATASHIAPLNFYIKLMRTPDILDVGHKQPFTPDESPHSVDHNIFMTQTMPRSVFSDVAAFIVPVLDHRIVHHADGPTVKEKTPNGFALIANDRPDPLPQAPDRKDRLNERSSGKDDSLDEFCRWIFSDQTRPAVSSFFLTLKPNGQIRAVLTKMNDELPSPVTVSLFNKRTLEHGIRVLDPQGNNGRGLFISVNYETWPEYKRVSAFIKQPSGQNPDAEDKEVIREFLRKKQLVVETLSQLVTGVSRSKAVDDLEDIIDEAKNRKQGSSLD